MPLVSGHYPTTNVDYVLNGKQAEPFRTSIRVDDVTTDVAAALVTQVMTGVAIALPVGFVVTKIGFLVGATAAGTPTNQFAALYSNAATPALLGQSTDTLTAAIAANTLAEYTLATPVTITADGVYILAYMVKATTVPSIQCKVAPLASTFGAFVTGALPKAATSGSALTGTAPATWASPTTVVNRMFAAVR